jgi:acyl-homoserine-lactone acylase
MKQLLFIFLIIILQNPGLIAQSVNPKNITIVRDKWGVAHIFAKTDAEVAYGLAWANAEDNFATMQELYLMAKGLLGRHKGVNGALYDFVFQAFDVEKLVNERFEKDLSPAFRKYLDGYIQGINAYAKKHQKAVIDKNIFPITGKDMIQGYVMAVMQEQGVFTQVGKVFNNGFDAITMNTVFGGSNGMAVRRNKTEEGKTFLLINPHQPLQGIGSIYEVHLQSEEGLNVHGGLWHGSLNAGTFANEHLACMTTTNQLDFVDIFQLQINPKNPLQYYYDGKWLDLEEKKVKVKTKIWQFLKWNLKRTTYQSVYGPTFKTEKGTFAIRLGGNMTIKPAEQLYQMNKATNFTEFKRAVEYFPFENFIYADKNDTIYLVNNGLVPKRNPTYNWAGTVPGNTSATLWTDFHSMDELVHYTNPKSGYLYNTNNSTFFATASEENHKPADYPAYFNDRYNGQNNRALRLEELLQAFGEKISYAEFRSLKYDIQLPKESPSLTFLKDIQQLDATKYPDVKDFIIQLKNWDRRCTADSEAAATFLLLTYYFYTEKGLRGFINPIAYDTATYIEALQFVKQYLQKHFKKSAVPMGTLMRYRRGKVDLPLYGYPDVLAAVTAFPGKDGIATPVQGDSFFMFVQFDNQGVTLETSQAYGNSADPDSPHYTDQMQNYIDRKTKKMTLSKAEVMQNAVRSYSPE